MNKLQLSLAALAVALASTSAAHASIVSTAVSTSDNTGGKTVVGYSTHTDTYNIAVSYTAPKITNHMTGADLTTTLAANTVIADATAHFDTGYYALTGVTVAGANSKGIDVSFSTNSAYVSEAPKYIAVKDAGDDVHIVTTATGKLSAGVTTVTYTLSQFAV
ncbi:TPA: hypothetical protein ACJG4C_002917 [Salmonella enterica subsp. diarizonae serovar 61:r:z53]